MGAHTRGVGQAVRSALDAGVEKILVAVGGSCSTDAGVGALRELGAVIRDAEGREIGEGGAGLADVAHVDLERLVSLPSGGVEVLCDVTNPLCGPDGAAIVFGPQKGATPNQVRALEGALQRFALAAPLMWEQRATSHWCQEQVPLAVRRSV
jgi:glycerate kinase